MMKQAVLKKTCELVTEEVRLPELASKQVLVQVICVGICGSDISTYNGTHPYKKPPTVLGHEMYGEVVEIGSDVNQFAIGDRVCSSSFSPCGMCRFCQSDQEVLCSEKVVLSTDIQDGAFSDYISLDQKAIFKIDPAIDPFDAALVEPLSIAYHGLKKAESIRGAKIAIIGSGSIGLACLLMAKHLGVEHIVLIDIHPQKAHQAIQMGATSFLLNQGDRLSEELKEVFGDYADLTILASGHSSCLKEAVELTKPGGTLLTMTYSDGELPLDVNALVRQELRVLGSALCTSDDMKAVIELIETQKICPKPMITHKFYLQHAQDAFKFIEKNKANVSKVLILTDEFYRRHNAK